MFELGPFAPALHTGVGECLGKAGIDCLVAVGELAEHIAQGARNSGVPLVYHCTDKEEAKPVLDQLVRPGSTILVKASRGMELEELTAYLLSITPEGVQALPRTDREGPPAEALPRGNMEAEDRYDRISVIRPGQGI